jgi:hypothetical protein
MHIKWTHANHAAVDAELQKHLDGELGYFHKGNNAPSVHMELVDDRLTYDIVEQLRVVANVFVVS